MGFEKIDKTAEELQRQVNQEFSNEPSVLDNGAQTPLTNAENESLTGELSGEAQGLGFTDAESEALTNGLSGNNNGILTETNEEQILGEALTSNYANGTNFTADKEKILQYKTLLEKLKTLSKDDDEYYQLLSEIERTKLSLMNDTEQKNYITAKIWNAFNNKDVSALENILNNFYEYKFEEIEYTSGLQGIKEFLGEHTNSDSLAAYINTVLNNSETNISKAELIWETVKAVSDVIEKMISAQGTNLRKNFSTEVVISALKHNSHVLKGAVSAYFGMDVSSIPDDTDYANFPAGSEAGKNLHHEILTDEDAEIFRAEFNNISARDFRSKINEADTLRKLNIINEIIDQSNYTKAEKQMLKKECEKQLGIIQSDIPSAAENTDNEAQQKVFSVRQNIEDQRIRSLIAYDMYNQCKLPVHKSMAQLLISDSRIYLADKHSRKIFIEILEQCSSKADFKAKQKFIEKALENPKLLNEDGAFNNYIMYCIRDVNANNIKAALRFLDEYDNSNSGLNGNDFSQTLYNIVKETQEIPDRNNDIAVINLNENPNTAPIISAEISGENKDEIQEIQNIILSDESLINSGEELILKDGTNEYSYPELAQEILENLAEKTKNNKNDALVEFCYEIFSDPELNKDITSLKVLSDIVSSDEKPNTDTETSYYQSVYNALKTGRTMNADENEILSAAEELRSIDYSEYLNKFIQNGYVNVGTNLTTSAAFSVLERKTQLFKNFTTGRSYTNELLYDLFKASQKTYCIDVLTDLSKRKEFSAKDIIQVANLTSKNTVEITNKVLSKSNLTSEEKVEVLASINANREQMELIKLIMSKDELNLKTLPQILKSIKILDEHNAGGKYERINLKKLNEYTALLRNPKTENWVVQMLNKGFDMETISHLNPNEADSYYEAANGTLQRITNENIKFFLELGMTKNEAIATVNAISKNSTINQDMKEAAIELLHAGTPKDLISEILNSANVSGVYNPHITADAMSVLNMGLNAFAERYLPIINNLSAEEIKTQFSPFTIKQLKGMITQLPKDAIPALRVKGFDIDEILKKLRTDVSENTHGDNNDTGNWEYRHLSEISGLEKYILNKYAPPEKVWHSKSATKAWADEKYLAVKNEGYFSAEEPQKTKTENEEKERAARLDNWFKYIENEPDIRNNPFAKLLLAEFVTKDSLSGGSKLPPVFSKQLAENIILNAVKANSVTEQKEDNKKNELPAQPIKTVSDENTQINKKKLNFNI